MVQNGEPEVHMALQIGDVPETGEYVTRPREKKRTFWSRQSDVRTHRKDTRKDRSYQISEPQPLDFMWLFLASLSISFFKCWRVISASPNWSSPILTSPSLHSASYPLAILLRDLCLPVTWSCCFLYFFSLQLNEMMAYALNITDEEGAAGVCMQVWMYVQALPFSSCVVQDTFSSYRKWRDWTEEHFEF